MISNAIPGITNANAYVNTQSAKGIAAKQSSNEFQKMLTSASADNKAAELTTSFSKTLTTAANKASENQTVEAKQDTVQSKVTEDKNVQTTETKQTDKNQQTSETPETTKIREDTETNETAEIAEEAAAIDEVPDEAAVLVEEVIPQEVIEIAPSDENLDAAILEAAREVMEQLADELNLDIEDIEAAMATLGLTNVTILDPTNMTQLIGELTGADDVMEIVTNADVYLNVQNMQDAVDTTRQELMQEFNLTEEDLSSALQNFAEDTSENALQNQTVEAPVTTGFSEEAAVVDISVTKEPAMAVQQTVQPEVKNIEPEVIDEENATETPQKIATEVLPEIEKQEEGKNESETSKDQSESGSAFNHMMNQISASLTEDVEPEAATQQMSRANTEQIMEQITEAIKINIKAETTTMELQLHPASLGTVNVMIEQAKDGNMIARFMTQNEDVKAALEGQLQQLVEKFNEQGVKVTAIEVAVNANGFDQTLNDSQSQKDDDKDAQESVRKPMRRIRLGDLTTEDGIIEGIDEEDKLTAEMMAINGNSVDFSA